MFVSNTQMRTGMGWFWSYSRICVLIEAYEFHILFLSGTLIKILLPAGYWRAQKSLLLTKPPSPTLPSPTLPYCQHLREHTHPILRWHFLQEDTELPKLPVTCEANSGTGSTSTRLGNLCATTEVILFVQEIVGRCHNRGRIIYTTATCRTTKEGKNNHKNSFQTAPHTRWISFL